MLETRIAELTAAIVALTAQLQGQAAPVAAAPAAAPATPAPAPAAFAAPAAAPAAAAPLANGMPGGPFTAPAAAAAPAFTPAAAGAPFTDLAGCTKYAMDSYAMLEAKGAGRGEVVTQLIQHLCGSNSINDLPVAAYPSFYTELEKQKAL
jgi:Tfp pilus assembly protein FimV